MTTAIVPWGTLFCYLTCNIGLIFVYFAIVIAFFRKNLFFNSLMLLPYTALVRIRTLLSPTAYEVQPNDTTMVQYLYSVVASPMAQSILAIFLLFVQAWAVNRLSIKFRISKKLTLIPGLLYILFASFFPPLLVLSPVLLATSAVIWVLYELFSTYKRTHTAISLFNTGFAVGLATILVPSMSLYILVCVLGLTIIKSFKLIELLQQVIGFGAAIYLYFSLGYLIGLDPTQEWSLFALGFNLDILYVSTYPIIFGALVVAITLAVFSYNKYLAKKSIQIHKSIDMLFWSMLVSLLVALLAAKVDFSFLILLILPLSLLLNMNLQRIKNGAIAEFIHLALLALLFVQHFVLA